MGASQTSQSHHCRTRCKKKFRTGSALLMQAKLLKTHKRVDKHLSQGAHADWRFADLAVAPLPRQLQDGVPRHAWEDCAVQGRSDQLPPAALLLQHTNMCSQDLHTLMLSEGKRLAVAMQQDLHHMHVLDIGSKIALLPWNRTFITCILWLNAQHGPDPKSQSVPYVPKLEVPGYLEQAPWRASSSSSADSLYHLTRAGLLQL